MLKKDAEVQRKNPPEVKFNDFRDLKKSLPSPLIVGLQKRGCRYMVDTDASNYDLLAVLLNDKEKSAENREKYMKEGKTSGDSATEWVTIGYW